MKAAQVILADLNTYDDLCDAKEEITNDYLNVMGGIAAWRSGYETKLTVAARVKLQAIDRKINRLFP